MTSSFTRMMKAGIAAGLLVVCSQAAAGPLGVALQLPMVAFDNSGTTHYDAASGALNIVAGPSHLLLPPLAVIGGPGTFRIVATVDAAGNLIAGTLRVEGNVDLGGGDIRSGLLLEGTATAFAAADGGATFAAFDFVFTLDGGALADLYSGRDVAVEMGSEHSNFVDFQHDFSGGAKGNLGGVPQTENCSIAVDKQCMVTQPVSADLACDAKIAATTLRYTGPTVLGALVELEGDSGSVASYASVDLIQGETILTADGGFSIDSALDGEDDLGTKMRIYIDGVVEEHHTSCSAPYVVGEPAPLNDPKGDPSPLWSVENFRDKDGDFVGAPADTGFSDTCEIPAASGGECERRPSEIRLRYTGGDCSDSIQAQDDDKFSCDDFGPLSEPARILITKDGDSSSVNADQSDVGFGELVIASAPDGDDQFDSQTLAQIMDANGNVLQAVSFHTSCSQPLRLGDRFGGLEVVGFTNTDQGTVQAGTEVIYRYVVTNNGDSPLTATVTDTSLTPANVPGSPLALAAFSSEALLTSVFADGPLSGTVTATGTTPGGQQCNATDTLDITIAVPPPCSVAGDSRLKLSDNKIEWKLSNTGDQTATIERIDITWPVEHGDLRKIKRGGDTIFETPLPPVAAAIENFVGSLQKRQIEAGDNETLKVEFKKKFKAHTQADFAIMVQFAEGCSVTF